MQNAESPSQSHDFATALRSGSPASSVVMLRQVTDLIPNKSDRLQDRGNHAVSMELPAIARRNFPRRALQRGFGSSAR